MPPDLKIVIPKVDFSKFEPGKLPGTAPARHEPSGPPAWLRWEWLAGLFLLSLLAGLLHGYRERKQTGH
jgi:hypothetical protein